MFAAKPDKSIVKINIPGVGEIVEAYNGKHAWTVSAMTGRCSSRQAARGEEVRHRLLLGPARRGPLRVDDDG